MQKVNSYSKTKVVSILKYITLSMNLCQVVVEVDTLDVVVEEVPDGHGEVVVAVNDGELPEDSPHSLHRLSAVL